MTYTLAYATLELSQRAIMVRWIKMSSVVACLSLAGIAHAQMYRCVDAGRTVFQEQPCKGAGGKLDIRPQAGDVRPTAPQTSQGGTAEGAKSSPVSSKTDSPDEQLKRMQRDRRLREIDYEISRTEQEIRGHSESLDAELAGLKYSKGFAKNNQAGATWEQSISTEMQAITEKYKIKLSLSQGKLERLRSEQLSLRNAR